MRLQSPAGRLRALHRIYTEAFPPEERMPWLFLLSRAVMRKARLLAICQGDETVGMAYVLHWKDICYLLFLAIRQDCRGQGIGSETIRQIMSHDKNSRFFIALEKDDPAAPNADERLRRRCFYERLGLHPLPYRMKENTEIYDLMGTADITPEEYLALAESGYGKAARSRMDTRLIAKTR